MPLINGLKMACEPCIRGHRSTKCTHANERLMVPVRKPGRPLSSCPHPSSRPCSCASSTAITAAIPRKQKCHCGPSDDVELEPKIEGDGNGVPVTPVSPTRTTNPSFRVQKSSARAASSRKQTISQAEVERMDTSQINVVPSSGGEAQRRSASTSSETVPSTPSLAPYGSFDMSQTGSPFTSQPIMFPMFSQPIPPAQSISNGVRINGSANGTATATTPPSAVSTPGGCCGGGNGQQKTSSPPAPTHVHDDPEPKQTKSCCSSRAEPAKPSIQTNVMGSSNPPAMANGVMMPQFNAPVMMPNGMYSYFPQPTIFTYPPQYGSYLQPLQLEQWRQFMTALTLRQFPPSENFGMHGSVDNQMNASLNGAMNGNLHGSVNGAANNGLNGTMNGSISSPVNGSVNGSMNGSMNNSMNGSMNGSLNGMMNGAMDGSLHGSMHGPLNGTAGGTINGITNGAQHGTMNDAMNGAMNGLMNGVMSGAMPFPLFVGTPNSEVGTSHQCGCGDGCQCVGCAAHPYNEATRNSVRAALDIMAGEAQSSRDVHRHAEHTNGTGTGEMAQRHPLDISTNGITTTHNHVDGNISPAVPPSPSDATSGNGDEQVLSANDFFFVSYEFEGSCSGETANCPCGDDCQCIGCVIHSIPDPEAAE
ncbi:hypothetical protein S7711_07983 [Stachybotrys chartarum IBT 7711]|uniref:Copper-fist domain-containing protein n=1 Tax=Stachybotrys chartarum (strain CBS 109288 / IBT 7711) TaxID=1280523 RepID=A0A084AFA7_STACB|nr:hypothetical protein S7711_07983 [Stachybotrys chartarum IBT 7711]KFA52634.1 hypothetical protein S40293_05422 [Stachybotrys chartarum IBT 40293]